MINFGTWNHWQTKNFIFKRVRVKGYKWTPFCSVRTRKTIKDITILPPLET